MVMLLLGDRLGFSQGYIVPNGVVVDFNNDFFAGEIDVLHNPASDGSYTGFLLNQVSANTFQFDPVVDIGVHVFWYQKMAQSVCNQSCRKITRNC
jgi:hypothetical protein